MRYEGLMKPVMTTILVLLAAGCGSSSEETAGGGHEATSGGEEPGGGAGTAEIPWAQKDHEQRRRYMVQVVLPAMTELFQSFDAQRYGTFRCTNCHGDNAQAVNFHMPNTLHPLDPQAMPTPQSSNADEARYATFMSTHVTPKMVELLGVAPYDMQTQQGFGCFGCHATVQH
jgi:hypothetical protein